MLDQVKAAKSRSVPLLWIKTMDNAATQRLVAKEYSGDKAVPMISWDSVGGVRGVNEVGQGIARQLCGDQDPSELTSPIEFLSKVATVESGAIVFVHNLQMFISQSTDAAALIVQGLWNLRDLFKRDRRTLIVLGSWVMLPPEINQDFVVIDEPLPTDDQFGNLVEDLYKAAKLNAPAAEVKIKAVDALRGLAMFPAEQVTAMSLTKDGLDIPKLWTRKIQMIEQTPGLSIWRGKESFATVRGYANAQNFLMKLSKGREAFRSVLFIDEIEKHLAGATGGDLSGVKQDMLQALLVWMQDRKAFGIMFVGVPGSGKSAMAKAVGNESGTLVISFDLAGMQESLVGKSGQNIRNGLKVCDSISGGNTLVIATCNSLQNIPPELRRRFAATFFFDVPGRHGKDAIWNLYRETYGLKDKTLPNDDEWTGAEIEKCCQLAWRLDCKLTDAASFIVPVAKSAPEQLRALRKMANGTFLSASDGGVYRWSEGADSEKKNERDITLN